MHEPVTTLADRPQRSAEMARAPECDGVTGACDNILCDACSRPGNCCREFTLNRHEFDRVTDLEVLIGLAMRGLPFSPVGWMPSGTRKYTCHMLDHDGRCTIYENRPDLCRDYKPASDLLCVMMPGRAEILSKLGIKP